MRAVLCEGYGSPDKLVLAEIDKPAAGPGQVLVKVRAAALNFFDTLIIENQYQFKPDLPFSPSGEIAGEIEAVGEGVDPVRIGTAVVAYIRWGGARDYVVINEDEAIEMPHGLPFEKAAGADDHLRTTFMPCAAAPICNPGRDTGHFGRVGRGRAGGH